MKIDKCWLIERHKEFVRDEIFRNNNGVLQHCSSCELHCYMTKNIPSEIQYYLDERHLRLSHVGNEREKRRALLKS